MASSTGVGRKRRDDGVWCPFDGMQRRAGMLIEPETGEDTCLAAKIARSCARTIRGNKTLARSLGIGLRLSAVLFVSAPTARAKPAAGRWELLTEHAAWQPRDSAMGIIFHDRMWILGG